MLKRISSPRDLPLPRICVSLSLGPQNQTFTRTKDSECVCVGAEFAKPFRDLFCRTKSQQLKSAVTTEERGNGKSYRVIAANSIRSRQLLRVKVACGHKMIYIIVKVKVEH